MPLKGPAPVPSDLKTSLAASSTRIKDLATALSERFERIDAWLSSFPGKTTAFTWEKDADEDSMVLGLSFDRFGRNWGVHFAYVRPEDTESEWKPISEASLKLKLRAVELLPALLNSLLGSTESLSEAIVTANKKLDALSETLGIEQPEVF